MAVYQLAKAGYGSVPEIEAMDTPQFLNLIEFEQIIHDIDAYHHREAKNHGGRH